MPGEVFLCAKVFSKTQKASKPRFVGWQAQLIFFFMEMIFYLNESLLISATSAIREFILAVLFSHNNRFLVLQNAQTERNI